MATIDVIIDKHFETPCVNGIKKTIDIVKRELKLKGIEGTESLFKPVQNALNQMYETELAIAKLEYAIKLKLYYLSVKEKQDKNFDKVSAVDEIDKKINEMQQLILKFNDEKQKVELVKRLIVLDVHKKWGIELNNPYYKFYNVIIKNSNPMLDLPPTL